VRDEQGSLLFVNKKKQRNFPSIGVYGLCTTPMPQGK